MEHYSSTWVYTVKYEWKISVYDAAGALLGIVEWEVWN